MITSRIMFHNHRPMRAAIGEIELHHRIFAIAQAAINRRGVDLIIICCHGAAIRHAANPVPDQPTLWCVAFCFRQALIEVFGVGLKTKVCERHRGRGNKASLPAHSITGISKLVRSPARILLRINNAIAQSDAAYRCIIIWRYRRGRINRWRRAAGR